MVVRTATMASADFCRPIDVPYDASSSRQTDRSPRVIHATFLPYTRRIYSSILLDDYRVLKILAFSPGWNCLVCDFCSSGRKFACGFLQIPPRGGHPCRSASGSRHQGPQRTFTSKSPISHHSRSDGACAPRAMPGAPKAKRTSPARAFRRRIAMRAQHIALRCHRAYSMPLNVRGATYQSR